MRWTGKLTNEQFRSRCTTCPDRSLGSCVLAAAVLGPDYRPDNCDGPQTLMQQETAGVVGENFSLSISVTTPIGRICPQDRMTIPGQVVDGPPPQGPPEITGA